MEVQVKLSYSHEHKFNCIPQYCNLLLTDIIVILFLADDDLFTGMFSGHYSNPSGFCFDIMCVDEPVIDNPKLQGYNVHEKVCIFNTL